MKHYMKIILTVIMIFLLTACSSRDNSSNEGDSIDEKTGYIDKDGKDNNNDNNLGKNKLEVWTYFSNNEQKIFDEIANRWAKEKDVNISISHTPFADYKKQVSVAIASDSLPDVMLIDNPDHAAFAQMGVFEDITSKVSALGYKDLYFDGPLQSTMYDNKYYGLPLTSNCLALFYNKTMFEEAGAIPPTNWEELIKIGKKIALDGVYPLGIALPKSEEGTFQTIPWLVSSGGKYDNLNSSGSKRAFEYLKYLIDEKIISVESINLNQGDIQKQFSAGKLAMFVGGPWMIEQIKTDSPNLNFGVVKIPKDKKYASVLGGENIGILSSSNNKELAWEFISQFGEFDIMKEFISQTGYFPPRTDVAQDDTWTKDPIKSVFAEQMEYAVPRGPHPKWPEISSVIYTVVQEIASGTKEINIALDDAQEKLDKLIK